METFEIRNLSFTYPEQDTAILGGVSFAVPSGQFLVVIGPSGCGKTTLLRHLKTPMTPAGTRTGEILFEGEPLNEVPQGIQSYRIGYVQQSAENQIVTDKVWHELAFGLESLGFSTPTIRERVAEMASFFGIQSWFYKDVSELSGGQKQLLNLASVMAMQPSVLILDEPTSQLDPIAASDFLAAVGKINRELGTTVIMTEHRLEEVMPMADRVLVMENGKLVADGTASEVGTQLKEQGHGMFLAMPSAMQIWAGVEAQEGPCPVTVRDGRNWLKSYAKEHIVKTEIEDQPSPRAKEPAISLEDVWFKYEKDLPDVIKGLSLTVQKGELYAILGGNGTGKSTTLSLVDGLRKPYRGTVKTVGTLGMLPQNPQTLFVKKTVLEDLEEMFRGVSLSAEEKKAQLAEMISLCRLENLLDRHPYDLSGGEQQRLALAKVLLKKTDILLMDEPTKGLDAEYKVIFADTLRHLKEQGVTVLMVSHDVEFCAEYADRCALFFDGNITMDGTPREFFSWNNFYTTAANRIARDECFNAITVKDVICACGGVVEDVVPESAAPITEWNPTFVDALEHKDSNPLPIWRKALAVLFGGVAIGTAIKATKTTSLSDLVTADGLTSMSKDYLLTAGVFLLALVLLAFAIGQKTKPKWQARQLPAGGTQITRRTKVAVFLLLLCIPLTLFGGVYFFDGRQYYLISLLVLLESMLPFVLIFEGRKPQTRELVLIAALCAITIAGRAAFFMLPNFKPVLGLVIIAGVALGGETGFLVGATSMLVSNMLFGQGPWTPWQMFAMGIIGFLAGILYKKGVLRRNRLSLCVFGAISTLLIYGGLMNPASALIWAHELSKELLISYYVTGFPVDLVHAGATVLTLWFFSEPMLEKLDRIKEKYGLIQP